MSVTGPVVDEMVTKLVNGETGVSLRSRRRWGLGLAAAGLVLAGQLGPSAAQPAQATPLWKPGAGGEGGLRIAAPRFAAQADGRGVAVGVSGRGGADVSEVEGEGDAPWLRLETVRVAVGSSELFGLAGPDTPPLRAWRPEGASDEGAGQVVRELGPGLQERVEARPDGVELSWRIERRPRQKGPLTIELALAGAPYTGEAADGHRFGSPVEGGPALRVGPVAVVDAAGVRSAGRTRLDIEGGRRRLIIEVPATVLETAEFPLVVDPIVGPAITFGSADPFDTGLVWAWGAYGADRFRWLLLDRASGTALWENDSANPYGAKYSLGVWDAPARGDLPPVAFRSVWTGTYIPMESVRFMFDGKQFLLLARFSNAGPPRGDHYRLAVIDTDDPTRPLEFQGVRLGEDDSYAEMASSGGRTLIVRFALPEGAEFSPYRDLMGVWVDADGRVVHTRTDADGRRGDFRITTVPREHAYLVGIAAQDDVFLVVFSGAGAARAVRVSIAGDVLDDPPLKVAEPLEDGGLAGIRVLAQDGQFWVAWSEENGRCGLLAPEGSAESTRCAQFAPVTRTGEVGPAVAPPWPDTSPTSPKTLRASPDGMLLTWSERSGSTCVDTHLARLRGRDQLEVVDSRVIRSLESHANRYAIVPGEDTFGVVRQLRDYYGLDWSCEGAPGSATGLWFTRYDAASLAPIDDEPVLFPEGHTVQMRPEVATSGDQFLVVWEDVRTADADPNLFAMRLDRDGQPLDDREFPVAFAEGTQIDVRVAGNDHGYLAVWRDKRFDDWVDGLLDIGVLWMLPIGRDGSMSQFPRALDVGRASSQTVSVCAWGEGFLVAWLQQSQDETTGEYVVRVLGARVDADGYPLDDEQTVFDEEPGMLKGYSGTALLCRDDGVIAAWGAPGGIFRITTLDAAGTPSGRVEEVVDPHERYSNWPKLANLRLADGGERVLLSWPAEMYDCAYPTGVRLSRDGVPLDDVPFRLQESGCESQLRVFRFDTTWDGTQFIAAWADQSERVLRGRVVPALGPVDPADHRVFVDSGPEVYETALATNSEGRTLLVYSTYDLDLRTPRLRAHLLHPGAGCSIDGALVPEGATRPDDPCWVCDPQVDGFGWSPGDGLLCDDGDPCTGPDVCALGLCVAGEPVVCEDDGDPCTAARCEAGQGCVHGYDPVAACEPGAGPCREVIGCTAVDGCLFADRDGAACDDGEPCTVDTCVGAVCVGVPRDCDDGDACTTDRCDPELLCVNEPRLDADGEPCDDGDDCTEDDVCLAGTCAGTAVVCEDDGDYCTEELCVQGEGCVRRERICPPKTCREAGTCSSALNRCVYPVVPEGTPCDDGNVCTVVDTCSGAYCIGEGMTDCDDGDACTYDLCYPDRGCENFDWEGRDCDDGDTCTVDDTCIDHVCVGERVLCEDDGDPCTREECVSGVGCVRGPEDCDDGNVCTADSACVPGVGCLHEDVEDGAACDDGDPCTGPDACVRGVCRGPVERCNDGEQCTTDVCIPGIGCQHTVREGQCFDGDACTYPDYCAAGRCVGGPARGCDDGDPCTADRCDPVYGCESSSSSGAHCDDGDACTVDDVCADGHCEGTSRTCDDGNPCTASSCEPETGCVHETRTGECDDGDVCTTGDRCAAGVCLGDPVVCDDGDPCTRDLCDPTGGCYAAAWDGPCDDGDPCTIDDRCRGGVCAGDALVCDDGDPCTSGRCEGGLCAFEMTDGPCDDGDACTTADRCLDGDCVGQAISCDDGEPCTDDRCDPLAGCRNLPLPDGTPCPGVDVCHPAVCAAGACVPDAAGRAAIEGCCVDHGDCDVPAELCDGRVGRCRSVSCTSCEDDADCGARQDAGEAGETAGNRCVQLASGWRCLVACGSDGDGVCPEETACEVDPDRGSLCVPLTGDCECVTSDERVCHGGDLYWLDSCGAPDRAADDCEGRGCVAGACCVAGTHEEDGVCRDDDPIPPPVDESVAEPVIAEPVVAEPVVAEPVVAEPVVAEPVVAEPVPDVVGPAKDGRAGDETVGSGPGEDTRPIWLPEIARPAPSEDATADAGTSATERPCPDSGCAATERPAAGGAAWGILLLSLWIAGLRRRRGEGAPRRRARAFAVAEASDS